jgi:hypothetical protein
MNCKQIREEIDAASRYELYGGAVKSHLNACPDCHRYSNETASLLGLLGAQPRVEVPTDFEFRLRARMARARAAAESDQQGFLRKIRPETFSWEQMVAAATAFALAITVLTLHSARNNPAPGRPNADAANSVVAPRAAVAGPAAGIEVSAASPVGATPIKFTSRSAKVEPSSFQTEGQLEGQSDDQPEIAASPNDIAGIDDSTRLYSPETKRLLKDRSRFYGAETVSISQTKPAGAALTF